MVKAAVSIQQILYMLLIWLKSFAHLPHETNQAWLPPKVWWSSGDISCSAAVHLLWYHWWCYSNESQWSFWWKAEALYAWRISWSSKRSTSHECRETKGIWQLFELLNKYFRTWLLKPIEDVEWHTLANSFPFRISMKKPRNGEHLAQLFHHRSDHSYNFYQPTHVQHQPFTTSILLSRVGCIIITIMMTTTVQEFSSTCVPWLWTLYIWSLCLLAWMTTQKYQMVSLVSQANKCSKSANIVLKDHVPTAMDHNHTRGSFTPSVILSSGIPSVEGSSFDHGQVDVHLKDSIYHKVPSKRPYPSKRPPSSFSLFYCRCPCT